MRFILPPTVALFDHPSTNLALQTVTKVPKAKDLIRIVPYRIVIYGRRIVKLMGSPQQDYVIDTVTVFVSR